MSQVFPLNFYATGQIEISSAKKGPPCVFQAKKVLLLKNSNRSRFRENCHFTLKCVCQSQKSIFSKTIAFRAFEQEHLFCSQNRADSIPVFKIVIIPLPQKLSRKRLLHAVTPCISVRRVILRDCSSFKSDSVWVVIGCGSDGKLAVTCVKHESVPVESEVMMFSSSGIAPLLRHYTVDLHTYVICCLWENVLWIRKFEPTPKLSIGEIKGLFLPSLILLLTKNYIELC